MSLYVGSRQAGSINEVESPNDPVIEGQYKDYIVMHKGPNFSAAYVVISVQG